MDSRITLPLPKLKNAGFQRSPFSNTRLPYVTQVEIPSTPRFGMKRHPLLSLASLCLLFPNQLWGQQPVKTPNPVQHSQKKTSTNDEYKLLATLKFSDITSDNIQGKLGISFYFSSPLFTKEKVYHVSLEDYPSRNPEIREGELNTFLTLIDEIVQETKQPITPNSQTKVYTLYIPRLELGHFIPVQSESYKVKFVVNPQEKTLQIFRGKFSDDLNFYAQSQRDTENISLKTLDNIFKVDQKAASTLSPTDQLEFQKWAQSVSSAIPELLTALQETYKKGTGKYTLVKAILVPQVEKGTLILRPIDVYANYKQTFFVPRNPISPETFTETWKGAEKRLQSANSDCP